MKTTNQPNNCRICVSLSAKSVKEIIERIREVPENADLIEIRFDSLLPAELNPDACENSAARRIIRKFPDKTFLFTLRPLSEGGFRDVSDAERHSFWNSHFNVEYADMEHDQWNQTTDFKASRKLISFHDFDDGSAHLSEIEKKAMATDADIVKIAVLVSDAVDGLDVWQLFKRFEGKLVPIAMGNAGIWTRVLGPAFGAPLSYASSDSDSRTAPGQVSFTDLTDVYRVKSLSPASAVYGVISKSVGHSLSPYMHNAAIRNAGLDAVYIPFEVKDLTGFVTRMVRPKTREINWNLRGFSVTIPFKEQIIEHLDFVDPTAEVIGAVNTVQIVEDKLVGFNTDALAFTAPLVEVFGDLKGCRVVVLGAGGAARACVFGLNELDANTTVVARDRVKSGAIAREFDCNSVNWNERGKAVKSADIIVNATPLGTAGELEDQSPIDLTGAKNLQLAYDLVYNPIETRFLREATKAQVKTIGGLSMLVSQGMRQFELWNGKKTSFDVMDSAVRKKLQY